MTTQPPTTKEALEPKLTMTADELFALHPLPWTHHFLLIKDANDRQVIHTGGLYNDCGRLHEGSYLSGLNALLVELVNSRVSAPIVAPEVDHGAKRRGVLNLIERFQREPGRAQGTINALEWLRRQIEAGNHVHHAFVEPPPGVSFAKPEECFRCGLPRNAIMHMAHLISAPASTVAPQQSGRNLMLEARRILMLLHDPPTHGPNYAAVENEIATALRVAHCDAYEDSAVIAENCSQDEAARDEPFRIAQTIREQAKRFLATAAPASPAALPDEAEAERLRIIAYLSYDTVYSDDFCVRCKHEPSNCECAIPVYMAGFEPDEKLKALKVALFQEQRPRAVFDAGFATTPPSTLAKAAAKEIIEMFAENNVVTGTQVATIIERCLAGGGDGQ